MKQELDKAFWQDRYIQNQTGWDIGYPSTPLKEYIDQLEDKTIKILIPGCGNAYEAEYLIKNGFGNVYVIDLSPIALKNFHNRVPEFDKSHLICKDFFNLNDTFDLIIEQTFFCALEKNLRSNYVQKIKSLLKPNGKLVGLLFNDPLYDDHPPFGGNKKDYSNLFAPYFNSCVIENCYNSIEPRKNREFFIMISD